MVIRELLQEGVARLKGTDSTAPQLDAAVLLCHVLGKDRVYLTVHAGDTVDQNTENKFMPLIKACADGVPVAYLVGKREFMSLEFMVTPDVLIPRPDTETLCEWVIRECKGKKLNVLDLCCGSGCIGLSLAHFLPDCRVVLADISQEALEVAQRNAEKLGVADRTDWLQVDLLHDALQGNYDVIVCNPPYIESDVIETLERGVRQYEPRLALDGGTDGLIFYRRLFEICPSVLKKDGILALEVGEGQAAQVAELYGKDFYDCKSVCDLAGIPRVVTGRKK